MSCLLVEIFLWQARYFSIILARQSLFCVAHKWQVHFVRQVQYFGGVVLQVFPQERLESVSSRSVSQESPKRVSRLGVFQKIALQGCLTRMSHGSVSQERLTKVSHKVVSEECPQRASCNILHKSAFEECLTKVSLRSVLQECLKRMFSKSALREPPTGASSR